VRVQEAQHRRVSRLTFAAFLLTAGVAWLTPLAFSGFRSDQALSRFWLLLSDSGTHLGIGPMLLLASGLVAARQVKLRDRVRKSVLFFSMVSVITVAFAAFNEFATKPLAGVPRPFVKRLAHEGLLTAKEFYALPSRSQRSAFLEKTLETHQDNSLVKSLHPDISKHWISMTGFSFPSGHSLVAFLIAVNLAFLVEHLVPRGRWFSWIPLLWAAGVCLSRMALGVHSALDITVGALLGGITSCLMIWSGLLNRVIRRTK
tara:strand:+ start:327 stop:1103 length:777 start_codon:yes stop_codon:yes gene_type:complete